MGLEVRSGTSHCELPRDTDPVDTLEPLLVGTGLLGMPEVDGRNWAFLGSQGLAWPGWAAGPSNLGHASAE